MMMHIRKANIEEAQAIIDLHADTVRRINARDYSPEQIELWIGKRRIEITQGMIRNGEYYVAVDEHGHLFGTGHMKEGCITGLYVSADHQGEGVGSAILGRMEVEAIAGGAREMTIDSTLTAAPFYRRMGYEEIGRKNTGGRAQLDFVIMKKELSTTRTSPTSA